MLENPLATAPGQVVQIVSKTESLAYGYSRPIARSKQRYQLFVWLAGAIFHLLEKALLMSRLKPSSSSVCT